MAMGGRDMIERELQQAVERLHDDIARVEFWTDALASFSKPIPDYRSDTSKLHEFMLPQGGRAALRVGANGGKK